MKKIIYLLNVFNLLFACIVTLHTHPFTWTEPINISNVDWHYCNEPSMCIDNNGNIFLVWRYPSSDNDTDLYFAWSDGQTWSPAEKIYDDDRRIYNPNLVVDSTGTLHLCFERFYADFSRVFYMKRESGIWDPAIQLSVDSLGGAFSPEIIVDNDNWIYVFWGDVDIYWTYYDGSSWSDIQMITNIPYDHLIKWPEPAVDNNNDIHLVYTIYSQFGRDLFYQKHSGNDWSEMVNISQTDTLWSFKPHITVDSINVPHVVWQQLLQIQNSNYDIYYSTLSDSNEWSTPVNISNLSQLHNTLPKIQILDDKPIVFHLGEGQLYYSYLNNNEWILNSFELNMTIGGIFDFIVDRQNHPHLALVKIETNLGDIYYTKGDTVTNVTNPEIVQPDIFSVGKPYPNPFNSKVHIEFSVPQKTDITVKIYNIAGKEVRRIINQENFLPGQYEIVWDGNNQNGNEISSGIYFLVFSKKDIKSLSKIILVK